MLALLALAMPLASADLEASLRHIVSRNDSYVDELRDLVAIPSVSALSSHAPDILRAADWVKARLERAGLNVRSEPCTIVECCWMTRGRTHWRPRPWRSGRAALCR